MVTEEDKKTDKECLKEVCVDHEGKKFGFCKYVSNLFLKFKHKIVLFPIEIT